MTPTELFPRSMACPLCALCAIEGMSDTPNPYKIRKFRQAARFLKHHYPSPTLTKSSVPGSDLPWAGNERIGDKRAQVIASFPLSFRFDGTWKDAINRIGNSVPPLFMYAIAAQIRYKLFGGPAIENVPMIDYPAHLAAMWQRHLAPREPDAPTVISTFAGAGGSSLGYSMAGFHELLAVEWDNNAVETFKLNFPGVPVYHGDIAKLSVDECLSMAGIEPGQLDILDGSPPCQGFSTAGKRIMDDPRNQLFREYVRLLRGLRPKVFVMENVSGMVKGKMKLVFVEILKELKASGYRVSARLLNAMYFHVPQSRERMIFIGVRDDLGIEPTHPKAEGRPVTLKQACEEIEYLILGAHGSYKGRVVKALDEPSPTLCKSGLPSYAHGVLLLGQSPPSASDLKQRRWKETRREGNHSERFSLHRLDWDSPAATIQKTATGSTGLMHPDIPRELYAAELKRIGSYPDAFDFPGSWADVLSRIGNSVPPLFMEAIARHIRQEILNAVTS